MKQQAPDWVATSPEFSERLSLPRACLLRDWFSVSVDKPHTLPIFTFYLLRDWDRLKVKAFLLVPSDLKPFVNRNLTEVDQRLNAFILGQLKVCLALAGLYSVGLLIAGIKLAVPIGLISGLLFIVPYLGTVIGIVLALLMSLLEYGIDGHIIAIIVYLVCLMSLRAIT